MYKSENMSAGALDHSHPDVGVGELEYRAPNGHILQPTSLPLGVHLKKPLLTHAHVQGNTHKNGSAVYKYFLTAKAIVSQKVPARVFKNN